ncbi:MAG TPA: hypothetical protein VFQ78_01240 [Candidatus Udaeobacter sp.]|nr:hypothetical protein [Candidatus Udaeobacter sp.]
MKTILLLEDGKTRAELTLQNADYTTRFLPEPEGVAGCNCDRWGHPCSGCVNANAARAAVRPFLSPLDE